jgi:hypothetical protein
MKKKVYKSINTVVYTHYVKSKSGYIIEQNTEELKSTKYASFCVVSSHPTALLPLLLLTAKQHNLDVDKEDQFEYAMEQLKSAISWN